MTVSNSKARSCRGRFPNLLARYSTRCVGGSTRFPNRLDRLRWRRRFREQYRKLFVGRSITAASTVINNLLIPSTAVTGKTYARFRFSQTPVTSSIGDSSSGEVEDYELTILANPYSNPSNRLDVNNDGFVSPIDALQVLNFLNLNGTTQLTLPVATALPPYLDVNGDGSVSSIDALQVINFLNARLQGGEGESQEIGWCGCGSIGSSEPIQQWIGRTKRAASASDAKRDFDSGSSIGGRKRTVAGHGFLELSKRFGIPGCDFTRRVLRVELSLWM